MKQSCEQFEALLSGYLDNELTQQQRQRVELHLQECDRCRSLLNDFHCIKSAVQDMPLENMDAAEIDVIMSNSYAKILRHFGWISLITGLSIWIIFSIYHFFDAEGPLWVKLIISIIVGGLVFLFCSVWYQRLFARKTDNYRKITL